MSEDITPIVQDQDSQRFADMAHGSSLGYKIVTAVTVGLLALYAAGCGVRQTKPNTGKAKQPDVCGCYGDSNCGTTCRRGSPGWYQAEDRKFDAEQKGQ